MVKLFENKFDQFVNPLKTFRSYLDEWKHKEI